MNKDFRKPCRIEN